MLFLRPPSTPFSPLFFLSLSQFTSLESSLFFFVALRALDRVHFERAPARASMWSFTGVRLFVSFSNYTSNFTSRFDLNAMASDSDSFN